MYHFKCAVSDCTLKCSLEVTQSAGFTIKSAGFTLQVSTLHFTWSEEWTLEVLNHHKCSPISLQLLQLLICLGIIGADQCLSEMHSHPNATWIKSKTYWERNKNIAWWHGIRLVNKKVQCTLVEWKHAPWVLYCTELDIRVVRIVDRECITCLKCYFCKNSKLWQNFYYGPLWLCLLVSHNEKK
jgi:hypothetical protein